MTIVFSGGLGSVAVRTYSEMTIIGGDGHCVETFAPHGIDDPTPTNITGVTIDGISQFSGLTNGAKTLAYTATGDLITWDGGEAVNIFENGTYTLYDSDTNNYIIITVVYTSLPVTSQTDAITVGDAVLGDQITIIQLGDELLTDIPVVTDASGATCTAAGTFPYPTAAGNYAIDASDKTFIAVKNGAGTTTISIDYAIYNKPRSYSTQSALEADHKADTEIAKAAAKVFANGGGHVSVINTFDGTDGDNYATCLTQLETESYDYDIIIPTVDVEDANFVLCSAHAITYMKIIVAPKIGTASVVRAAMGTLTVDEVQYGVCYDTTDYTVGELAGAAATIIARQSPWIPCEWGSVTGINTSGYSRDDIALLEGTSNTLRVNTFIQVGSVTCLSSGRALKAGTWLDIPRTKQFLRDGVMDDWVSAKLIINNSNQKIPYTAEGLTRVASILRKSLKLAQKKGALREDSYDSQGNILPGYIITMPNIEDIPVAYKAARVLPDVAITAYLSGAIESAEVQFTVSLGEV